ncbi:MAG: hypothetical protein C0469_12030 [Cyanobacteria bacterium DS2.3.42]|nr:hypothetical protein [Cyanobacteria bacterium DS2.3.42]
MNFLASSQVPSSDCICNRGSILPKDWQSPDPSEERIWTNISGGLKISVKFDCQSIRQAKIISASLFR